MRHLHEETLSLLALGEPASAEEQAHLDSCPQCAGELAAFGRVVAVGRSTAPGGSGLAADEYPPSSVWEGIHRTLNLSDAVREDPAHRGGPAGLVGDGAEDNGAVSSADDNDGADVIDLQGRRRGAAPGRAGGPEPAGASTRRGAGRPARSARRWLPAAAAAAAVVAGAAVWGTVQVLNREPETLAAANLQPLPAYQETGRAEVDRLPDGRRELVVRASGTDAAGYREVWLLAPDAQSMVSLGTMEGTEARFPLPEDLDLDSYPVVDISDEPFDGNPAHSGDSILRGELEL